MNFLMGIWRKVTFLGKSVCFRAEESLKYDFGKRFRGNRISDNENRIFEVNQDFWTKSKRYVVGALIPHVGYLLISGSDAFIAYISGLLGNEYGVEVLARIVEIYLRVEIKKASNEFADRGNIFDMSQTFTGATLSSNDYEGGFAIFQPYRDVRNKWTSL